MSVYKTRSLQTQKQLLLHLSLFSNVSCLTIAVCPDSLPVLLLGPLLSLAPGFPFGGCCSWQHLSPLCGHTGNVYAAGTPSSSPTKFTCRDAVALILASQVFLLCYHRPLLAMDVVSTQLPA